MNLYLSVWSTIQYGDDIKAMTFYIKHLRNTCYHFLGGITTGTNFDLILWSSDDGCFQNIIFFLVSAQYISISLKNRISEHYPDSQVISQQELRIRICCTLSINVPIQVGTLIQVVTSVHLGRPTWTPIFLLTHLMPFSTRLGTQCFKMRLGMVGLLTLLAPGVFSTSSPVNGSELQNGTSYHLETWWLFITRH